MAAKRKPDVVIARVDTVTYQALRRYFAKYDIDRGQGYPYVWDLRIGAANRWQDEDVPTPHIRYGLRFRRGDGMDAADEVEYAQAHGKFPKPPSSWSIVFDPGTFPESYNPAHHEWMKQHLSRLEQIEERQGKDAAWEFVHKHAPTEMLPNPDNWSVDQAKAELARIIPEAERQLVEEDPGSLTWEPRTFIIPPPEPEE